MVRVRWLVVALLLVPLADAALLVAVAGWIGAVETVALVVLTALVGMLFVRAEGRHTLRRLQRSIARGEQPTDALVDGALLVAAGAFLLTPGLVTDAIGFLLVVPPTRVVVRTTLMRFVLRPRMDDWTDGFVTGRVYTGGFPDDDVVDVGSDDDGGR